MVQPNATEKIAIYVEKLGRLAAAAIRMQPDIVVTTVPNLQAVVAEAFALAAATPGTPAIVPLTFSSAISNHGLPGKR